MTDVRLEFDAFSLTILIDDFPHVILRRNELVGIETWLMTKETVAPRFYISFFMRNGMTIDCDYDRRDLWEAILREIYSKKLFHPVV